MLTFLICCMDLALFALPLTMWSLVFKDAALLNLHAEIFSSWDMPTGVGGLRIGMYCDCLRKLVEDEDLCLARLGFNDFFTEFSLCLFKFTFFTALRCMSGDLLDAVM